MNKVVLEKDGPKIVLDEATQKRGYLEIEEAWSLLVQSLTAYCKEIGME